MGKKSLLSMKYQLTINSDSFYSHFARVFTRILQDARKLYNMIILILCIAILIIPLLLNYSDGELYIFGFKWPLHCFLYQKFGIKCSLCGLTHSFYWLAHGNFHQSLMSHSLGPAVFTFICLQIPYRIYALLIYPKTMKRILIKAGFGLAAIIAIGIFVNWLIYLGGFVL